MADSASPQGAWESLTTALRKPSATRSSEYNTANRSENTNSFNDILESCQRIWKRPRTSFTRRHYSNNIATNNRKTKNFANTQTSPLPRQNISPQMYHSTPQIEPFRYSAQADTASKHERPDTWLTLGSAESTKEQTRSWSRRSPLIFSDKTSKHTAN